MRRLVHSAVLIVVVMLVAGFGQAAAQAALLDANCPSGSPLGSVTGHTPDGRDAQTFTALHTGQVVRATLLIDKSFAGGDFQLQILAANASGPIDGILGSATIPDASVPLGAATLDATFGSPASVVAGQLYALVVARPAGSQYNIRDRGGDACDGREFFSSSQNGTWAADDPAFDHLFQVFVNPPNQFTIGKLKGRNLTVNVPGEGAIAVVDATSSRSAAPVTAKAKAKKLLKTVQSTASGPGTVTVTLRLTKAAKKLIRQNGKLKARAVITYTPSGGEPNTQRTKLRFKR